MAHDKNIPLHNDREGRRGLLDMSNRGVDTGDSSRRLSQAIKRGASRQSAKLGLTRRSSTWGFPKCQPLIKLRHHRSLPDGAKLKPTQVIKKSDGW